jgi:tetratricopeptide (TPR) repeat protein
MESLEFGQDDDARDSTNEVPKAAAVAGMAPRRSPAGTLAPPLELDRDDARGSGDDLDVDIDVDLDALRSQARQLRSNGAWSELAQTLRRIVDLGELQDTIGEEETIALYAEVAQIEDDELGHVAEAVDAWRKVLALDAADLRALDALENLFERDDRWEEAIEVLEKRALVLDDDRARCETLLRAAALYEDQLADATRAVEVYERVRRADPDDEVAAHKLEALYGHERRWAELVELMLERSETCAEVEEQIQILLDVARIYERELDDQESAFYVLQAAFGRDYAHERSAREFQRLGLATQHWQELVDETSKAAGELEHADPDAAAELWVKVGRWYSEQLAHVEHAIGSVQHALRVRPQHAGAVAALADLQRKRGSSAAQHAASIERQAQDGASAIAAYEQVLVHDPASHQALDALDRLYRRAEAWEPLVGILSRRAELADDEAELVRVLLDIGSIYDLRLVDAGAAIAAYEKAVTVDAGNVVALRALEALYDKTDQNDKHLAMLEAQLEAQLSDTERVAVYERIAALWEERFGNLDRAAAAYEHVLAIDPRNYAAYHLLERLYQQAGRPEALVETYRNHIRATADVAARAELYAAIGKVCETKLHDLHGAIEAYDAALSFDGDGDGNGDAAHALGALARLYEQTRDWDRALDALGRLVRRGGDTRTQDLYCRMGRIQYGERDDADGAEASWLRGLAADADHLPTMEALTGLYSDRGDWLKAAQMMVRAESATQVVIDKVRLLFEAATLYMSKLRSADEAKRLYAAVIALDPEHVAAGRPLAELYFDARQWAELQPVIDMLCRKADQRRADPSELHPLYFRAARCADELDALPKARDYYEAAYRIDATHLPMLIGRADLLFKLQDWDNAAKCYQAIVLHDRGGQDQAVVVRSYNRLGRVRMGLGERKQALAMFAKALDLEPHHRDSLEAVIELQAQRNDWEAVAHAKRSLMETADERERTKLAQEIATVYRDRLQNAPKATAAYLEALETAPEDRQLLQKVLDLYIDSKQWRAAVEIIERFIALESDAFRKGVYAHAAATICRDELKSLDEAVDYFDCALDGFFSESDRLDDQKLPRALASFEAIDTILTTKRDWKAQERAYRDMIKRLPSGGDARFAKLHVGLIDGLGEIYRSRLKQYDDASGAFEIAQQLDPDNKLRHNGTDRAEILAELHMLAGPDRADKAIEQHLRMLRREPFKYDSYKALARIYKETQQYDKHWCLCNALAFLKKADPDEQSFYEHYKPRGLVKARNAMSPDVWAKLAPPDENRYISAIFGACWESVAAMKAFPHKDFGVKREDRRQLQGDQLMFSKLFVHTAKVLNVRLPDVYLLDDQKAVDIQLANATEKSELCPSFMVRPHLLQGKSEREVAFLLARKLTFMRPEYYLRMLLPTNGELKVVVLSAIAMVQPRFPVPPNLAASVQEYLPAMQKRISPHALEQLGAVVHRFVQATPEINLAKWGHAVDAASHRAGVIVCGDLTISARAIAIEPVVVDGPTIKDKVREIVLFSISEEYFHARAQMGITING